MNTFRKGAPAILALALAVIGGGLAAQRAEAAKKIKKDGKKATRQAAQNSAAQESAIARKTVEKPAAQGGDENPMDELAQKATKKKRTEKESAAKSMSEIILENDALKVWLDPAFPRALRYEWKKAGATFEGAASQGAPIVEINGAPFRASQQWALENARGYSMTPHAAPDLATYTFHVWQSDGALSFALAFRLENDALKMRLQDVVETGNFRLRSLYFPNHQLLSIAAGQPNASVCRVECSRKENGIIRIDRTYKGPVQGLTPESASKPTHWAFVYTDKGAALLQNNIPVFPIEAQAFGDGETASRVSLWNGEYYYRVKDETMAPLECQVTFVGDQNGDGRIDWMDGAAWLRAQLPDLPPTYDDAFVYKISCCRLPDERFPETLKNAPNPTVYTTFDQCLEIIKKLSNLTHGAKQIIYLVGWQHQGHDSRYPDLSVVNPWLGGKEKLLALIEEAKRYNATVSLHVNCDAAYKDSPGWDPDIICRGPDGELAQWETQHGQPAWHISHYKDVKKGSALKRIDDLLTMLPIQSSIHYDAFRYTNESWEPGGHIDMTAEMLGVDKIVEHYAQHGITLTIESFVANPALAGKMKGSWHIYAEDEFFPFLLHRKWIGGGSKRPEGVAYGLSLLAHFENATTPAEMCDQYYLWGLTSSFLRRREMTRVANEGKRLVAEYGKSCVAECDKSAKEFRLTADGITVAKGDDRFVPVSDGEILVYSKAGGAMEWTLPSGWPEQGLSLFRLTENGREKEPESQVKNGVIRFKAQAAQPYVFVKGDRSGK